MNKYIVIGIICMIISLVMLISNIIDNINDTKYVVAITIQWLLALILGWLLAEIRILKEKIKNSTKV
jgi:L-asparagine transporter-like permease